ISLILDDSKKCKTSIATVKPRNHLQIGMHLILAEKQKNKKVMGTLLEIMKVVRLCYPFLVSSTEIKGPKEFTLSVSLCILGKLTKFGANPSPILRSCWIDLTSAFGLMVTSSGMPMISSFFFFCSFSLSHTNEY
ncbi:hypothetical protein MTR67_003580, partial [Solanum verrucosum]